MLVFKVQIQFQKLNCFKNFKMRIFRHMIYISALEKKLSKDQEELVELKLEGRAKNTIKQYNGA